MKSFIQMFLQQSVIAAILRETVALLSDVYNSLNDVVVFPF